ncbi:IS2 transposase TnpB (plasmid) [Tautonia plasticadhaerens]|uniref:IS2 transposase TnpB n=2 Tax=Tautonia plasticadhaerens TaxID=2527974 RepID=A0A518HEL5_9BACT|nr:IS2 transposase TnpB [Tautonia plasticadhaerens]QDV39416.1 IS2 transposase TnpB [Tautonia plasticadhaerens]
MPAPGERPPFCREEAEQLARSASPGTGKRYGMQRVCRIFGIARSTAYYLKAREAVPPEQRPVPHKRGPVGAGTGEELVGHIRRVLAESPFTGEGYRKVWARLRHQGIRTASERVRRLMREHRLQAPRRGGHPHGPKAHDGTITTEEPDSMWGTDMTTTVTTGEGLVHVFVAVDHCTCECVGLHVAERGERFEALEPLRQGVREHFGGFDRGIARGLAIRHDHGSAYMSDDFQRELTFLGMASSPSFVREPEGNGCAERFVRTLKEQLLRVRSFATVVELAEALGEFKRTYNERWVIRRHGHRTPSQVRRDLVGGVQAAA